MHPTTGVTEGPWIIKRVISPLNVIRPHLFKAYLCMYLSPESLALHSVDLSKVE